MVALVGKQNDRIILLALTRTQMKLDKTETETMPELCILFKMIKDLHYFAL